MLTVRRLRRALSRAFASGSRLLKTDEVHGRLGAATLVASTLVALGAVTWLTVTTVQPLVWGSRTPLLSEAAVRSAAASVSPAAFEPRTAPSASAPAATPRTGQSGSGKPIKSETIRVDGGIVTVGCDGPAATLRSAQPVDGWSLDVSSRGPRAVDVTFVAGERESELKVSCVKGTPVRAAEGAGERVGGVTAPSVDDG